MYQQGDDIAVLYIHNKMLLGNVKTINFVMFCDFSYSGTV